MLVKWSGIHETALMGKSHGYSAYVDGLKEPV